MQTIDDLGKYTFSALLKNSVTKFSDRPALSYVLGKAITYSELNENVNSVKNLLHSLGIKPLDKIAIFSTSSPQWAISYFAIVTLGAVAVPLLPDFNENEASSCLKHSGAKAIFAGEKLLAKLNNTEELDIIINIEDFSIKKGEITTDSPLPEHECKEEDIASIIYTSGTTGRSKGVVLTHKNLIFTAIAGQHCQRINQYESALSILPMSHVYEFTIGFLMFMLNGACIYYLEGPPIPRNLLPALQKIRPHFMLNASPLIKKIYGTKLGRKLLCRKAGKKLKKTFGGRLKFFGIGGSKTDPVVEQFMVDAKFPYAIGYGLTETSPLIAYSAVYKTTPGVIGGTIPGVEIKIGDQDPQTGIGELLVKGPNVMQGYYNAPELTKEVFTEDGWFKTGDLCAMDEKGRISLKGRSKNMILGAAGENIYPEDIEFVLNQHPLVSEALVVEGENTSLVAYVRLQDAIGDAVSGISNAIMHKREEVLNEIRFFVNSKVNKFSKIDKIEVVEEFEKTASQKIKRYLYSLRHGKSQSEKVKGK